MANISKIKVPNDNTIYDIRDTAAITDLKTINSQSLEGSGNLSITENRKVWYGTCNTAASTQIKNVVIDTGMAPFSFTNGDILAVTFTNTNSADYPKISINGSSTSYLIYDKANFSPSKYLWTPGEIVYFIYYSTTNTFYMTDCPESTRGAGIIGSLGATRLFDSYDSFYSSIITTPTANAIKNFSVNVLGNEVTATPVVTTSLTLGSEFNLYSTTPVELKVWQHFASVSGSVKSKTAFAANDTQHTICTIPSEYCPSIELVQPMNGAGAALWTCRLKTTGELTFSRYRSANAYIATSTSGWLGFHIIWAF